MSELTELPPKADLMMLDSFSDGYDQQDKEIIKKKKVPPRNGASKIRRQLNNAKVLMGYEESADYR